MAASATAAAFYRRRNRLPQGRNQRLSVDSRGRARALRMAPLTFDGREVERERESKAGEKAGKKEQPRAPQPPSVTVDDGKHRHQNDIRDHVVLVAGAACRGGELSLDEFGIACRARDEIALPMFG